MCVSVSPVSPYYPEVRRRHWGTVNTPHLHLSCHNQAGLATRLRTSFDYACDHMMKHEKELEGEDLALVKGDVPLTSTRV